MQTMLDGDVAIVTGGGRGIGRAIVQRLLAEGASVAACGRGTRPDDLEEAVEWVQADVSRTADARRIVKAAVAAFGRVAILVNNAGVQVEPVMQAGGPVDPRMWRMRSPDSSASRPGS